MGGFRLGSILGFEIRIDLSWFIIFFLILWTLSANFFPTTLPGLSSGTYLGMGVVATLLFFASLLAHELSHSVVARLKGIPVEGITLFIFGGVSRIRSEAERPGDEFQITVVGPLTSLVLAGLFALLWWLGNQAAWPIAVTGVVGYLALINLLLAVFNLLPGFPLDGGRLFRAILWKVTGNLQQATRIAAIAGKLLGFVLIGLGIVQMFAASILAGLWLILIGWFLNQAADTTYQQQLLRSGLQGVRAQDIMTRYPETVPPDLTLEALVEDYFLRRRYHAYPVTANAQPLGLISLSQVKAVPREQWRDRTVADTMTPVETGVVVLPEAKMPQVLEQMQAVGSRRVLVARNGVLEGIITGSDLASWLHRHQTLQNGQH